MRWWDGITDLMDMILSKFWDLVKDREAQRAVIHGVTRRRTQLRDNNSKISSVDEKCFLPYQ